MAKVFQLDIVASDHQFYQGECEMLIFTSIDGEYGVLAEHEATVTCLVSCEIRYLVNGEWNFAAVGEGFVEMTADKVVLIADTVERPEEIDINRANLAKMQAEEQLRQKLSIQEYYYTRAALNRAMTRLRVSGKNKDTD